MSDHTDTTLTDTEREALGPFQWAFHLGVAEGRSYEAASALTATVESIVAARVAVARAEAWDEGHARCAYHVDGCYSVNPYRALIEGADQ